MGALMNALGAGLQAIITPLLGNVGILMITVAIAGCALAVIWWDMHLTHFWKVAIGSMVLLAAGAIAAGMKFG